MATPEKTKVQQRYSNKFNNRWKQDYPFIKSSCEGADYAFCKPCGTDFAISHGGINDLKKHIMTKKNHKKNSGAVKSTPKISFFQQKPVEYDHSESVVPRTCYGTQPPTQHKTK